MELEGDQEGMARLAAKGGLRKRRIETGLHDFDGLMIENLRSGAAVNACRQDRAPPIECEVDPRLAFRPAQAILDGIRNDRAGIDIGAQRRRVLGLDGAGGRPVRSRRRLRPGILRGSGRSFTAGVSEVSAISGREAAPPPGAPAPSSGPAGALEVAAPGGRELEAAQAQARERARSVSRDYS